MKLPTGTRGRVALIGSALVLAAGASGLATHQLTSTGASRATSQADYARLQAAAAAKRPTVPYLGPFSRNPRKGRVCGPEVRIMEGALRLTTPPIRKAKAEQCVGLATEKQIKTFQLRHDLPPSGVYGKRTHRALAHAYSNAQRAGLIYIAGQRLKTAKYVAVGTITAHAKAFEGRMVYCTNGSLSNCGLRWIWPPWPDVPHHTDCSGYVSWVYFQAGLPDPNGLGYTGGFTQTLVAHGTPVNPSSASHLHVGDLIFNGPSASHTTHVSVYIGKGLSSGHGRFGIQIHQWNYRVVVAIRRYF